MKNNLLDKITMKSSKRPIARFNLSHDVSTTFGFGEVSPIFCKHMDAHSKLVMSSENLVRLAPMLRPTFGRISLQTWSRFVPMTDIMPCYAEFLTKTRFNYGNATYTPVRIPAISLGLLSAMCLVGSKLTLYRIAYSTGQVQYECPKQGTSEATALRNALNTWYGSSSWTTTGGNNDFGLVSSYRNYSTAVLLGQSFGSSVTDYPDFKIPTLNESGFASGTDLDVQVTINEADLIVERTDSVNNESWAWAFKLSAFGKRIRKILLGLGYQINLDSKQPVSILPLLGYYIAYFNTFGIEQWRNYQDTACSKFIQTSLLNYGLYFNTIIDDNSVMQSYFCKFIMELGNCFYTENQDFVSAHIQNVENATHSFSQVGGFIDVGAVGATIDVASNAVQANQGVAESTAGSNAHAKIFRQVHSELDAKLLQKLYKCTNRDSVLGQKVAKQLEALGYGEWMKANPSTFIGHTSTIIRISDVISQSDTYQNGQGALLGDFGAKGVGYNEGQGVQKFTASVPGLWITFACIVPDSGYCQSVQGELLSVDSMTVYNPEFDGLGVEASQKLLVCGSADRSTATPASDGTLDATFGFVPRYTSLKVKPNVMSGDFSLRSTRNSFLPYTLDKFMEVNAVDSEDKGVISGYRVFTGATSFNPALLPLANAEIWRTPTKYGYLNNFNRIFALVGDNAKNPRHWDALLNVSEYFQLTYTDYDNFMCHMVNNVQFYSHMLKIEDSFETREDGNNGSSDMVVSKA